MRIRSRDGMWTLFRLQRLSREFEAKSLALADEFFEVGLQQFLGEVFEREDARTGEMGVQPFEEVQSAEYQNWRKQKQQPAVKRGQGVPEEQLAVDYKGYGWPEVQPHRVLSGGLGWPEEEPPPHHTEGRRCQSAIHQRAQVCDHVTHHVCWA